MTAPTFDPYDPMAAHDAAWEQQRRERAEDEAARERQSKPNGHDRSASLIRATPFAWTDPALIPRRQFLYGRHLIRGFASADIAPGGTGKSALIISEALAMVTGLPLLGDVPAGKLRVWAINLEDPTDELRRRIAATALHYRISPADIGDRLFLDSGRDTVIVLATDARDGIQIAEPVVDAIRAEIIAKRIDVVQVDPFVACHAVPENDNGKIAAVARLWAGIAEATGCAVQLVHHSRKSAPGQPLTAEDARGASAFIAAVRAARVLNVMTREEAERAGVDNPRLYFNVISGKSNLAPPAEKLTWRRLVGVSLGNGAAPEDPGDNIGVVEAWSWPDPFADVSPEDAKEVQRRIAKGEWREDQRSTTWAGISVAEVLGFDLSDKVAKATIRSLINGWIATDALRVVARKDANRIGRKFIEVGQWLP
jgi:AAA domain